MVGYQHLNCCIGTPCLSWRLAHCNNLGALHAVFEVTQEGLRLRGDLYGRLIPSQEILIKEARKVHFADESGLRLSWRTIGTDLPGYYVGWFRLKNGEKGFGLSDQLF